MRLRQPDVHREEPRLHAEAGEEDGEQRQRGLRAEVFGQRAERGRAGDGFEAHESHDEQHEAYVHHDKVGERGAAHLAAFGVEKDQQERGHGHQLPEEEERVAAVGEHDAQHGVEQHDERRVVQRDVGRGLERKVAGEVSARIGRRGQRTDGDDQHEECRQGVHRTRIAAEERAWEQPQQPLRDSGERGDGLRTAPQGAGADDRQRGRRLAAQRRGEQDGRYGRQRE